MVKKIVSVILTGIITLSTVAPTTAAVIDSNSIKTLGRRANEIKLVVNKPNRGSAGRIEVEVPINR